MRAMEPEFGTLGPARRQGGFGSLLRQGRPLEHFHLYEPVASNASVFREAVPFHIDMGAFLVLSKAHVFQGGVGIDEPEGTGFFLRLRNGDTIAPVLREGEALLLVGDAMRSFLGADVTVPRHAVRLHSLPARSLRAWHGRMYLFPDASLNEKKEAAKNLFMAPLHEATLDPWTEGLKNDCQTKTETCWMQTPTPEQCAQKCGQPLECLLPDLSQGDCSPDSMDDNCAFRCPQPQATPGPAPIFL